MSDHLLLRHHFKRPRKPHGGDNLILSGREGRTLSDIFKEYLNNNTPTPDVLLAAQQAAKTISDNYPRELFSVDANNLKTDGGILSRDSYAMTYSVRLYPERPIDPKFYNLEIMFTSLDDHAFQTIIKSMPISISVDHVEVRYRQRGSEDDVNYIYKQLHAALPLAMNMALLIDEQLLESGEDVLPIVLPTWDGMFLGIAEKRPLTDSTRLHAVISNDERRTQFVRPVWEYGCNLKLSTYFGMELLQKDQAKMRLHGKMKRFLGWQEDNEAAQMFGVSTLIRGGDMLRGYSEKDIQSIISMQLDLTDIMESHHWKAGARLPKTMRVARGLDY